MTTARKRGARRRSPDMRHITRADGAWVVRLQRVDCWVMRSFADSKHGGKARALGAAKLYRANVLADLPAPRNAPVPPGYGYVRRCVRQGRVVFEGWVRLHDGACSRTRWHADVHGQRGAKRGAEAWLAAWQRELR